MNRVAQLLSCLMLGVLLPATVRAQLPVYGSTYAHDPSRITQEGNTYYVFYTSQGIVEKTSTDLRNWTDVSPVFPGNPPAWTTNAVPGFTGDFWAPDVILLNGTYYLYYAVSTFGSQVSAIGLVTTTNLGTGPWTDQGAVIQSKSGSAYNCIDPCPLLDTNGNLWMSFGSYWDGIYLVQLNPATGKVNATNSTPVRLAYNSSIEGSFLYQQGGYYYLFVNWGTCCSGVDSTYNIRIGRSTNVAGPYLDRNGLSMVNNGGSMFLESTARFIGPGQVGIFNDNGTNWLTYHYYNGNNDGTPALGLGQLTWGTNGWPVFTNDWSAFYPFSVDAREHLGLYNGTLQGGVTFTNDPARGNVLNLNGSSQYAQLPGSVVNASTMATWVEWNGGAQWQRIFDFGDGTEAYAFLTPLANSLRMRFAITTNGNNDEQRIDAPTALPTNTWCHVAVTLDGTLGIMYLDGVPVATNTALTIRPWQTLGQSNYVGHSQFSGDPYFNGRIGSFRVFGRALSAAEIQTLASAPPSLAHRYSFNANAPLPAWDSIGMAHGMLNGSAVVTNGSLVLNGTENTYVNVPVGLLSGSAAATIEFWATFGTNGNWARVLDCGTNSGANGLDYLYFSPHNGSGGVQLGISLPGGTETLSPAGTYDHQMLHVDCIADPANNYTAIYTNGVLEAAQTNALPALTNISPAWSFIGRSLYSADPWLNANINELRIYDGRLTPQQIALNDQYGPDQSALPVTLSYSNSATAGLTLSWPAWAVGYSVLTSTNLRTGGWVPLTQTSSLNGNQWLLPLGKTNGTRFYRLEQ